jgi:hypothetical protein
MKNWITILLLISVSTTIQSQSYSSRKMEEIGSEIPIICLPEVDSIFNCPKIVKGKSLVVNYNQKQEINHLGISLFSNETKELINLPVCNFIERIMLELVLGNTKENVIQKLKRSKLNIEKNGVEYGAFNFSSINNALDGIKTPAKFTLHRESERFTAVWEYNHSDQFLFSFPASRELIFGTDKKESGELLNNALFENNIPCCESSEIVDNEISKEDLFFNPDNEIFTKKGKEFLIFPINSDIYYEKRENTFELLFSEDFPEESLSNLIIKNTGNFNHKLHITHRMYGHFFPEFDISLNKFLCFFRNDYDIFTGVSSVDSIKLKLTVILQNKDYNYIHLLLIEAPVANIFQSNGMLDANFYSNISQQNIKSLFADEIKNNNIKTPN